MAGVYKRVWAAVKVLDECSGKPVERSSVRMTLPMGIETVSKDGGLFLIIKTARENETTLIPEGGYRIPFSISGPFYETCEGELEITQRKQGYYWRSISLIPSVLMPPGKETTVLEGTVEPGSTVFAACLDENKLLRPVEVSGEPQRIRIYRKDNNELTGRYAAVIRNGCIAEILEIMDETEDNVLVFSGPVRKDPDQKTLPDLYLLNRAAAGENGYFRVMVSGISRDTGTCAVMIRKPDGREETAAVKINRGERNKITI